MKSMEFFILHRVVDSSTICSYQLTLGGISLLSLMGPKMLQSLNLNLQSYPDIYTRYFHLLSPFYTCVQLKIHVKKMLGRYNNSISRCFKQFCNPIDRLHILRHVRKSTIQYYFERPLAHCRPAIAEKLFCGKD